MCFPSGQGPERVGPERSDELGHRAPPVLRDVPVTALLCDVGRDGLEDRVARGDARGAEALDPSLPGRAERVVHAEPRAVRLEVFRYQK